jgi:hypothetical protein
MEKLRHFVRRLEVLLGRVSPRTTRVIVAKAEATRRWLKEAMDALLLGKSPEVETTAAPGCPIDCPPGAGSSRPYGLLK